MDFGSSEETPSIAEGEEHGLEKKPTASSAALAARDENKLMQTDQVSGAISAPTSQRGFNHLVLNCLIPGLGSFAHGNKGLGLSQLVLGLASIPFFFYHFYLGLPLLIAAYLWSFVSGLGFSKEKQGGLVWE